MKAAESDRLKDRYARLFDRTSKSHDLVGGLFGHFGSLLAESVGLRPGDRVLDLAAGTGASLVPAARLVGTKGHVVGVDLAPGMVSELDRIIERAGIENAVALVADAEELPFGDGTFDAVLCGFGLFFFPDPDRGLKEACRILRPGGAIALSTFTRDGSATMDRIWQRIGECLPVPPSAPDELRFHDPTRLSQALESAGFVSTRIEVSPFELLLPGIDAWLGWLRSMEFGDYVDRMDAEQLERFTSTTVADFADRPLPHVMRLRMDALMTRAHRR